jgi:hypothetical protein
VAAFVVPLNQLSDHQLTALLLSCISAVGSGLFALLCWLVKLSIRFELARMRKEREQDEQIQWIKLILALHNLTPVPLPSKSEDEN